MIEVYIIEEIERRRRERVRREEVQLWITDPDEDPRVEKERGVEKNPPRVIVIDL